MKTILLPIHDDEASEARLQVALDLARAHGAHLMCLQVTPVAAYIMTDMFGGIFPMPELIAAANEQAAKLRHATEARLQREDVSWSWKDLDGDPAQLIVAESRLVDLVVLSRAVSLPKAGQPLPLAGDVALHARTPVLAVPPGARGIDAAGPALVAWNGSAEAAHALRAALPMLRLASVINVVAVDEEEPQFPAVEACAYLARWGLGCELHRIDLAGRMVSDALIRVATSLGVAYVVMGAYGHSRARELLLGGVTRRMLEACPVPLLLMH